MCVRTLSLLFNLLFFSSNIYLTGNVTINEDPVHNPVFDENGMKLKLTVSFMLQLLTTVLTTVYSILTTDIEEK